VASALLEPSESKRPVSQALLSHANRSLTGTLMLRAIEQRYRGSMLGVLWAFLTPVFMLLIYTFVFGVVFQSRWGSGTGSTVEFAIILFAGITTFTLFSEVVSSAPALITGQPNLVKKIVFPLEILPLVSLGGALFQALIAYVVVLALQIGLGSGFHLATLALPVLIVPLCLFSLGLAWFLAALGVYVRDIQQLIAPVVTALMFLSAVFFPLSALPDWLEPAMAFNPIISAVEMTRNAIVFGTLPDPANFLAGIAAGLFSAFLGLMFFRKTRHGFADVL
jgi:lipopolysaccharide transport system permease protein